MDEDQKPERRNKKLRKRGWYPPNSITREALTLPAKVVQPESHLNCLYMTMQHMKQDESDLHEPVELRCNRGDTKQMGELTQNPVMGGYRLFRKNRLGRQGVVLSINAQCIKLCHGLVAGDWELTDKNQRGRQKE